MPPSKKSAKSIDFCRLPLSSSNFGNQSEIDARIGTTGQWKTIATVYSVAGADAEDIAYQIIDAMTFRQQAQGLFKDVRAFLKGQLKGNNLTKKDLQEAENLLDRIMSASGE